MMAFDRFSLSVVPWPVVVAGDACRSFCYAVPIGVLPAIKRSECEPRIHCVPARSKRSAPFASPWSF